MNPHTGYLHLASAELSTYTGESPSPIMSVKDSSTTIAFIVEEENAEEVGEEVALDLSLSSVK